MDELSDKSIELLEQKREELVKIIQSFEILDKSKEWSTLKELVFDKSLASIERQLLSESLSPELTTSKLYKLQGEYAWAKRFTDFNGFIEKSKKQLEDINKKIK